MRSSVITLPLGAVGAVLLAACGGSTSPYGGGGGGCTPTATKVCTTPSLKFNPATLTVAAGTTVTWENGGGGAHTVTSATGSADTDDMSLAAGAGSPPVTTPRGHHTQFHASW